MLLDYFLHKWQSLSGLVKLCLCSFTVQPPHSSTCTATQLSQRHKCCLQNTALLRQLRTAPQGSFDHVLDHLLVASIVINAISIVLAVLLATATEKSKTEKGQAVPGEGTPISSPGESGTAAKLTDDPRAWPGGLDARLQAMHPAGTHFYSAWLTYANLLVTLLGTVVLILNAVITGVAPAKTGS